jgi:cytoskeletal protein RodZ
MDGQTFSFAGQTEDAEFSINVAGSDDGDSGMLGIILIVIAILVLVGVGAFFFIEFEEVPDEDELTSDDSVAEEDPYAWAKAKQAVALPPQETQVSQVQESAAAAPAAAQHPGWLWDQSTNQWVPDPNYQPEQ